MIYVATNGNFLPKPFVQKIGASVIKRSEDELQVWRLETTLKWLDKVQKL